MLSLLLLINQAGGWTPSSCASSSRLLAARRDKCKLWTTLHIVTNFTGSTGKCLALVAVLHSLLCVELLSPISPCGSWCLLPSSLGCFILHLLVLVLWDGAFLLPPFESLCFTSSPLEWHLLLSLVIPASSSFWGYSNEITQKKHNLLKQRVWHHPKEGRGAK